jgi:hypothetical protein
MVEALAWSVENPPENSRVLSVEQIRAIGSDAEGRVGTSV